MNTGTVDPGKTGLNYVDVTTSPNQTPRLELHSNMTAAASSDIQERSGENEQNE